MIYTLGTPHVHPLIMIDTQMEQYYKDINEWWLNSTIPIISISGGYRDHFIESYITNVHSKYSLNILSHSIRNLHLSIDHQCLCWCNQLVQIIGKSISTFTYEEKYANSLLYHQQFFIPKYISTFKKTLSLYHNLEYTNTKDDAHKCITWLAYVRAFTQKEYIYELKKG
jgi:hypothetical protein